MGLQVFDGKALWMLEASSDFKLFHKHNLWVAKLDFSELNQTEDWKKYQTEGYLEGQQKWKTRFEWFLDFYKKEREAQDSDRPIEPIELWALADFQRETGQPRPIDWVNEWTWLVRGYVPGQ